MPRGKRFSKKKHSRRVSIRGRRLGRRKAKPRARGPLSTAGPVAAMQRTRLPFPAVYMCRLPYVFDLVLASNGALGVTHAFGINSARDPDVTGTGHQPYQFDQLEPMYGRYIVYGVKYSITFNNPNADGLYVGLAVRTSTNLSGNPSGQTIDYIKERKLTSLVPLNDTGSQKKTFAGYWANYKIFGVNKYSYSHNPTDYGAVVSQDPLYRSLGELIVINPAATPTISVRIVGTLTFYMKLFDYEAPAQSV